MKGRRIARRSFGEAAHHSIYVAARPYAMFLYSRPTTMPPPYSPNGITCRITDRGRMKSVFVNPAPCTPIWRKEVRIMRRLESGYRIEAE